MSDKPVATRRFTIGLENARHVDVLIYLPVEDQGDYRCRYEMREQARTIKEGYAVGVDSLQALILALQKLGADVMFSEQGRQRMLYWNSQNDDLGLLLPRGT